MTMDDDKKKLTRKEFLRIGGSLAVGGVVVGSMVPLVRDLLHPEGLRLSAGDAPADEGAPSPYRKQAEFRCGTDIDAFDLDGDRLVVAADGGVGVYDAQGRRLEHFAVTDPVRDLACADGRIYVLHPAGVSVYGMDGAPAARWAACSDTADYCALTVCAGHVFATDAADKLICQYTADGTFVRFIRSPHGFVVPSYSFGITHVGGTVYCSNPGRHCVESYDAASGAFLGSFGQSGTAAGQFCGCCNPVYLAAAPGGELITSEKGIPRISCYSPDGTFRSVLLGPRELGGREAQRLRLLPDGVALARRGTLALYKYDPALAERGGSAPDGACARCQLPCPLRRGVTV